jgi:hypothetical protein
MTIVLLLGTTPPVLHADDRKGFGHPTPDNETTTAIKHVVVIFDENISFDHYFGSYPIATNAPGEPAFYAAPDTPQVNGLSDTLKNANPNPIAPFGLDRSQAMTCDNDNHYTDEQKPLTAACSMSLRLPAHQRAQLVRALTRLRPELSHSLCNEPSSQGRVADSRDRWSSGTESRTSLPS